MVNYLGSWSHVIIVCARNIQYSSSVGYFFLLWCHMGMYWWSGLYNCAHFNFWCLRFCWVHLLKIYWVGRFVLLVEIVGVPLGIPQWLATSEFLHGFLTLFIWCVGAVPDVTPLEVFLGRFLCQIILLGISMPHFVYFRVWPVGCQVTHFEVNKLELVQHECQNM